MRIIVKFPPGDEFEAEGPMVERGDPICLERHGALAAAIVVSRGVRDEPGEPQVDVLEVEELDIQKLPRVRITE